MKKSLVLTLAVALLLSVFLSMAPMTKVNAEVDPTFEVEFSNQIKIQPQTGVSPQGVGFWGNHESRTVHTEHGDYITYTTDDIVGNFTLTGFSIIKVAENDGDLEAILLFEGYRARESSGVTMFADNDGNVWVVEVGDNRIKPSTESSSIHIGAYKVDAETDEVTVYERTYNIPQIGMGFGYGGACYDPFNNRIIAETADGDNGDNVSEGSNKGMIVWAILDLNSAIPTWSDTYYKIDLDIRYSYPYITADGNDGFFIVAGQDFSAGSAGYPEIPDHTISNEEDNEYYRENYEDQSAGYVWHSVHLFWIPNATQSGNYQRYDVAPADYSKVLGDKEYRYSLEGRLNNEYPNFQNNNGGETYLDSKGYLHVIWYRTYLYAASTRAEAENVFIHDIFDTNLILNGTSLADAKVSSTEIADGVADDVRYSFRLFEDTDGNLYYISGASPRSHSKYNDVKQNIKGETKNSVCTVYRLEGTPETGYTKVAIGSVDYTGGYIVGLSSRGNSTEDNVCNIVVNDNDAKFFQVEITKKQTTVEKAETVNVELDNETFASGTEVKAVEVESEVVTTAMDNVAEKFVAYEFTATLEGVAQQPNGGVKVDFNIPEGYDLDRVTLFYVESATKFEEIPITIDIESRKATANLTHFSTYVLAEKVEVVPTPTPVVTPTATPDLGNDEPSQNDKVGNILLIVFVVLLVAVIAVIVVTLISKKKAAKK